jgi:hypothetical protein
VLLLQQRMATAIATVRTMMQTKIRPVENTHCAECGMLVGAGPVFHPWLYCRLFKLGVTNPAKFLECQHFIPDPGHWGEDAPRRQREAAARRS